MTNNILLASKLVKEYNRKNKEQVYLCKAKDFMDWRFTRRMMEELGFPSMFVEGIMCVITIVSYFAMINGSPLLLSKGLRERCSMG